jgi:hypothetical protein
MKKNKLGSLIGLVAGAALAMSMVAPAFALTASDIDLLGALLGLSSSQIAAAKAALGGQTTTTSSGYAFNTNLTVGSTGADVTALQQVLVNGGYLSMPSGTAYGYFGSLTKAAVIKFQLAKGISPAAGYVGPITRSSLNSMGGVVTSGGGTVVVPSGTGLSVSLAPTSPYAGAIVAGQSAADLAEYTFTNNSATPAVVTNVSLMRGGVSADTSLPNVYLYQGAVRLTDAASVSSGKITFNSSTGLFTVAPGSSVTIAVKSDIDASASAGQIVSVALTGVTANIPVGAVYPISGSSMTVASASDISKATSTLTTLATNGGTLTAGNMNQTIWQTTLNLSGKSVWMKSLALKVIGSVPQNALQNFTLYASGVQVATSMGMDANGMVTFDLTSNPYKIDSSRTLEVRADIVGGSSRTFTVQLQNASDLQLIDSNYNVAIAVGLSGQQNSGTWTINGTTGGSVTVVQDTSLSSGDVISGASNVPLARFTLKAYGEDEKISYLNATSNYALDNVALYANGVQIGSTKNVATSTSVTFSIGSSLIVPSGGSVTLEIRGDIKQNGSNIAASTTAPIIVGILPYSGNTQGSYSQLLQTVPSSEIDGPSMTVKIGAVSFSANSGYQNQTVTPNTNNVKLGSYTIQAGSAEPVTVSSVTVSLFGTAGTSTNVSNLYVVANGQSTTPINPSASGNNNFTVNFTVPANGSASIDVYGNLSTLTGSASSSMSISGFGTQSNTAITATSSGQTLAVGQGTLATPSLQTGAGFSPVSQFVVGGSTSVVGVYNFVSTNGTSNITEMYFAASGTGSQNITSVSVGGKTAPMVSGVATLTGLNIAVPVQNAGYNVPVTVTFNTVGTNGVATNNTTGLRMTGFKYVSGNQTTSTTTLTVDTNLMTLLASKPTVSITHLSGLAQNGANEILKVTVSADAAGQINLLALPVTISLGGSSATLTSSSSQVFVNGTDLVAVGQATTSDFSSGSSTISFTGSGYPISAGQSVTFDIYANTTGANSNGDSVSGQIGAASSFSFVDVNGSSTLPIAGSLIYNYPINQISGSYSY